MSVDAACTGCCCEPAGPCCACPGTEVRIRINNVSRRLVLANNSIVLYDNTETMQADIRFRVLPAASCYSFAPFLPIEDLGSSWSIVQRGKRTMFYGQRGDCELFGPLAGFDPTDQPPNCKPCLTPEVKRDFTRAASRNFGTGPNNSFYLQCFPFPCACTSDFAGDFWNIFMNMEGTGTESNSNGVTNPYVITRMAILSGSAQNCLSSNTFANSYLQVGSPASNDALDRSPGLGLGYPCNIDLNQVPRECRDSSAPGIFPTGIRCVYPTGGDVGAPSVFVQGSGSLSSQKRMGCARHSCIQSSPFFQVLYRCGCQMLDGTSENNNGVFQYQVFVSQQLSVSAI